jgi:hypothetical protein
MVQKYKKINMKHNETIYDAEGAIKLMESRGYKKVATNANNNILFFLKQRDHNIHIHATVLLDTQKVDLDNTGLLDLGVTIYCESLPIEYETFPDFEEKLYNYTYLCIYGKPLHTVQDDTTNGLYFKASDKGSEIVHPTAEPIIGGAKTGPSKPAKLTIKERKIIFWEEVKGIAKQKGYPKELATEFYTYWTETNKKGTSFRREKENFFDIPKRFATWIKNNKKWSNKTFTVKSTEVQEEEVKTTNKNVKKHKDLF